LESPLWYAGNLIMLLSWNWARLKIWSK
jgi:hypothetical protein